jgi:hypothetical protein
MTNSPEATLLPEPSELPLPTEIVSPIVTWSPHKASSFLNSQLACTGHRALGPNPINDVSAIDAPCLNDGSARILLKSARFLSFRAKIRGMTKQLRQITSNSSINRFRIWVAREAMIKGQINQYLMR